jgi:hypothetical protein
MSKLNVTSYKGCTSFKVLCTCHLFLAMEICYKSKLIISKMGESRKKEQNNVWIVFKNYVLKVWKINMKTTIYIYVCFILKVNSYNFKVATTKFSWKFTIWTRGFLYQKFFSFIKCSPNHFNFFVNLNVFHKKGFMCSKNSKN